MAQRRKLCFFMPEISIKAFAKVNLFIAVLSRRDDGYHNIESLMQSIDLGDEVFIAPARTLRLSCSDTRIDNASNLGLKAAMALASKFPGQELGAEIKITKHIPLGAGLAGGSADAAAVLTGLNEVWELGLEQHELSEIGACLGSDIPFCLQGGTCWVSGRGEEIEKVEGFPQVKLIIGISPFSISTAEAYGWIDEEQHRDLLNWRKAKACAIHGEWEDFLDMADNSFFYPVSSRWPGLLEAKEIAVAKGAKAATLSGSGPTMFAVCKPGPQADIIKKAWQDLGLMAEIYEPISTCINLGN